MISEKYTSWQVKCDALFQQLKANEEEMNRIFIDIYGLQDELTLDVADKNISVHRVLDSRDDVPESMKGSNYVRTKRDEMDAVSALERMKLAKQQKKFQEQVLELQKQDEKAYHLADQNVKIDLDDGVKCNYELIADVLAKIK